MKHINHVVVHHVAVKHITVVRTQRAAVELGQQHIGVQRATDHHHLERQEQDQQKLMLKIIVHQLIQDVVQRKMADVNHSHAQHHVLHIVHVEHQHVAVKHIKLVKHQHAAAKHISVEVNVV